MALLLGVPSATVPPARRPLAAPPDATSIKDRRCNNDVANQPIATLSPRQTTNMLAVALPMARNSFLDGDHLPAGVEVDDIPFVNDAAVLSDDIVRPVPDPHRNPSDQLAGGSPLPSEGGPPHVQANPWPDMLWIIRPDQSPDPQSGTEA